MVAVEMASGRSGSSGESFVRCVDVLFSGAKDGLCGVSHTKLRGKFINCVLFIYNRSKSIFGMKGMCFAGQ